MPEETALTIGGPGLRLRVARALVAAWTIVHAALATTMEVLVWRGRAMRWALLGWAALDARLVATAVSALGPAARGAARRGACHESHT